MNIILDPIFIFVLDFGVAGAAIATTLSQCISLIILIIFTNKKSIPLTVKNLKINFYYIKEIFRGGLPSLFRQGCSSVSFVFLNHAAGVYGDAAIAANNGCTEDYDVCFIGYARIRAGISTCMRI